MIDKIHSGVFACSVSFTARVYRITNPIILSKLSAHQLPCHLLCPLFSWPVYTQESPCLCALKEWGLLAWFHMNLQELLNYNVTYILEALMQFRSITQHE